MEVPPPTFQDFRNLPLTPLEVLWNPCLGRSELFWQHGGNTHITRQVVLILRQICVINAGHYNRVWSRNLFWCLSDHRAFWRTPFHSWFFCIYLVINTSFRNAVELTEKAFYRHFWTLICRWHKLLQNTDSLLVVLLGSTPDKVQQAWASSGPTSGEQQWKVEVLNLILWVMDGFPWCCIMLGSFPLRLRFFMVSC